MSDNISSAQAHYERKILSVQQGLQDLGECASPSWLHPAPVLGARW